MRARPLAALSLRLSRNEIVSRVFHSKELHSKVLRAAMRDLEEEKLVAELDRDLSRNESLIGLVICLGLGGWLIAAMVMSATVAS